MDDDSPVELRVDSHVLVQLGSELVTDAEQAILECVKNAYDADSSGCRIEIDTADHGVFEDSGPARRLRAFTSPAESVLLELVKLDGKIIKPDDVIEDDDTITRRLTWRGRVTITDSGDGMDDRKLRDSWLVVSRSEKRVEVGPKSQTVKERTPLGDKGLGRLGTMKLGDILRVESSPSATARIATARFRWADCTTAATIDQIPVVAAGVENTEGFKGTKVSVLGLKDMAEWRRKSRVSEIAVRLTRLISPFETKSRFRVGLSYDGVEHSLAAVTEEILARCVARFDFEWSGADGKPLQAKARFRHRLFTPTRTGTAKKKADEAFSPDQGEGFHKSLKDQRRIKGYTLGPSTPGWFAELGQQIDRTAVMPKDGGEAADPGRFTGSFYYFHLNSLDDDPKAALEAVNSSIIKDMAGISILRDGFRVRSQGDWLELAAGMTSGSTYQLRVHNTVGFFFMSGRENFTLVEKSDREGFVENAPYRGFLAIARACRKFANDSLEDIRRAFDAYADSLRDNKGTPKTAQDSLTLIERQSRQAAKARTDAAATAEMVRSELDGVEAKFSLGAMPVQEALGLARRVVSSFEGIASAFDPPTPAQSAIDRVRDVLDANREQAAALLESAAIGLSARGMAHELRTHLTEIRKRTAQLERIAKGGSQSNLASQHVRAIKGACTEIQKAAALIDPMLPRTRAIKETFPLIDFVASYLEGRSSAFERYEIDVRITKVGDPGEVHTVRPRLLQAFDNLVRNSTYWVQRDEAGRSGGRWIEVTVSQGAITVADSGPGVEPRFEELLFEMFVTGRPDDGSGQGLGLYITRNLLEAMGCGIELKTARNDRGRRFQFEMDLSAISVSGAP